MNGVSEQEPCLTCDGTWRWHMNGRLHRDGDLPAEVQNDGTKRWYDTGQLHRGNDLPAEMCADGTQSWYRYSVLHRGGDQPAYISTCTSKRWYENGIRQWYRFGQLHRDGDQPASICPGTQQWYIKGQLHRDGDQPAEVETSGRKVWYKRGVKIAYAELVEAYARLVRFGRRGLAKRHLGRLRRVRQIHGELLCMPPRGRNYTGGHDYLEMYNYFMNI